MDDYQQTVQQLEDEIVNTRQELNDALEQVQTLKEQSKDKDSVIEFVEQEVTKIKQSQDAERQEIQSKDELNAALNLQLEQFQRQIDIKNEEIKILLELSLIHI